MQSRSGCCMKGKRGGEESFGCALGLMKNGSGCRLQIADVMLSVDIRKNMSAEFNVAAAARMQV